MVWQTEVAEKPFSFLSFLEVDLHYEDAVVLK